MSGKGSRPSQYQPQASQPDSTKCLGIGVPYGSRTRVAAVKEKRPIVIQPNLAAWIALYRTLQTHRHCHWTLNGLAFSLFGVAVGSR